MPYIGLPVVLDLGAVGAARGLAVDERDLLQQQLELGELVRGEELFDQQHGRHLRGRRVIPPSIAGTAPEQLII